MRFSACSIRAMRARAKDGRQRRLYRPGAAPPDIDCYAYEERATAPIAATTPRRRGAAADRPGPSSARAARPRPAAYWRRSRARRSPRCSACASIRSSKSCGCTAASTSARRRFAGARRRRRKDRDRRAGVGVRQSCPHPARRIRDLVFAPVRNSGSIKPGVEVKQGDMIALSGNTGPFDRPAPAFRVLSESRGRSIRCRIWARRPRRARPSPGAGAPVMQPLRAG